MATNLALDPDLLDRVVAVSGEATKKAAVTLALWTKPVWLSAPMCSFIP